MCSTLRPEPSVKDKYEFIDGLKCAYPISLMCRWAGVSTSGYYAWRNHPETVTGAYREKLKELIKKSFVDSEETYGHRRIHAELIRWGYRCGQGLVRVLMRELGLVPCQPQPWRHSLTQSEGLCLIPDLVGGDFTARQPGVKLVGDITYIDTWEGWAYLATVIDCYSKEIVGYAMGDNYRTPLIQEAIMMAVRNGRVCRGAIFHSDRGSNYTSREFAATLKQFRMRQSVGRTGICYDNSLAESFFGILKNERIHRTVYPTMNHAYADIAAYILCRYNVRRLHSGIGYRTPQEKREEYFYHRTAA
jgi:putative transposase